MCAHACAHARARARARTHGRARTHFGLIRGSASPPMALAMAAVFRHRKNGVFATISLGASGVGHPVSCRRARALPRLARVRRGGVRRLWIHFLGEYRNGRAPICCPGVHTVVSMYKEQLSDTWWGKSLKSSNGEDHWISMNRNRDEFRFHILQQLLYLLILRIFFEFRLKFHASCTHLMSF